MQFVDLSRLAVALLLTAVLIWAAVSDIRSRRVPNLSVVGVLFLFAFWAIINHGVGLISALEAAGIAFAVTVCLYIFKILGAGDAKLFSAVALFAGLGHLPLLTIATALTGGAIAVASLATRPKRAMTMVALRGEGDYGRGVPYGVAIATGGAVMIWVAMSLFVRLPWTEAVRNGLA